MNLSEQMGEDSEIQPYALAPYLEGIIAVLLQTTERSDGDENNLRSAAYETLSSLVINSAPVSPSRLHSLSPSLPPSLLLFLIFHCILLHFVEYSQESKPVIAKLAGVVLERLQKSIQMEVRLEKTD